MKKLSHFLISNDTQNGCLYLVDHFWGRRTYDSENSTHASLLFTFRQSTFGAQLTVLGSLQPCCWMASIRFQVIAEEGCGEGTKKCVKGELKEQGLAKVGSLPGLLSKLRAMNSAQRGNCWNSFLLKRQTQTIHSTTDHVLTPRGQ